MEDAQEQEHAVADSLFNNAVVKRYIPPFSTITKHHHWTPPHLPISWEKSEGFSKLQAKAWLKFFLKSTVPSAFLGFPLNKLKIVKMILHCVHLSQSGSMDKVF